MSKKEAIFHAARTLMLEQRYGVLSTISKAVKGYPFGSVVPYCTDQTGTPIILISNIAQHTKNIMADSRVSLTILDHSADNVQANARLTLLAQAFPPGMRKDEVADRYYRYFPESKDYHQTHDFGFFRLNLEKVRYIGGFGEIHWLKPEPFQCDNPFDNDSECGIINHMNEDHQSAMRHYLSNLKSVQPADEVPVVMSGIDSEGFDLFAEGRHYRFSFDQPVSNGEEARQELVRMARSGKRVE